jgi:ubiquinone/menaquinone biosynthesis C-methylase UbiE
MEWYEFYNISERYMEIVDPCSHEKLIKVGEMLGMEEGDRVIDFGTGFAEPLAIWAETFGIGGVGIELREYAANRAREKMQARGFSDRIEIVQGSANEYAFEEGAFDFATCIGATFIWGYFNDAVKAMKPALKPGGKIAIGEVYWKKSHVPPEHSRAFGEAHMEWEILEWARAGGFDVEYIVRASQDDWDRYQSDNWRGYLRWIEENPDHPERQAVIDRLHADQEEYFRYGREYWGWAIYVLNPVSY